MFSFSAQRRRRSNVRYRFYGGLLIFLIPVSLSIIHDQKKATRFIVNEVYGKNYGELINGRTFEQSFVARQSHLNEVDLQLATFGRKNMGSLVLEVMPELNDRVLARIEKPTDSLTDNGWERFFFNGGVSVTKGAAYRIRLTSPSGEPGNAITWWGSSDDSYAHGHAVVDGSRRAPIFRSELSFSDESSQQE